MLDCNLLEDTIVQNHIIQKVILALFGHNHKISIC